MQVFSVLYIIQKIHEKYPTLEIENIGEPDFVIRYVPDPEKKAVQYFKTAIVCVILFFGGSIYNHDVYRGRVGFKGICRIVYKSDRADIHWC